MKSRKAQPGFWSTDPSPALGQTPPQALGVTSAWWGQGRGTVALCWASVDGTIRPGARAAAAAGALLLWTGARQPRKPSCRAHAAPPSTPPPEVLTRRVRHRTSALMRGTRSLVCKHPAVNDPRAGSSARRTALLRRKKSDFHHQGQIKVFVTRHKHRCPNASSRHGHGQQAPPAESRPSRHGPRTEPAKKARLGHMLCAVHDDNGHVSQVS